MRTDAALITRGARVLFAVVLAASCGDSPAEPNGPNGRIIDGVDLDVLFAPPTTAERATVAADWETRDVSAQGVREEMSAPVLIGFGSPATLRVVSHTVDGVRHYGGIIVPAGTPPGGRPVLVYAHGGDEGATVEELLFATLSLGDLATGFVYVIPSFRSETLRFGNQSWTSEGAASPWDRDVDDALALLNVALTTPGVVASRIGVLGLSRGAGVGLLMGVRDDRIARISAFFGPTDFFGEFVQGIVEDALRGRSFTLPGFAVLNQRFIQPLRTGAVSMADVRREMLRRSPVYFAERLRGVQVHHGTADDVVAVSQAHRLIEVLQSLGRGAPAFEFHIYPGGQHNPLTLPSSTTRTASYLGQL